MFGALETRLGGFTGRSVLDAFAGSGALGIEALSRGAERALFVDRTADAAAAVDANLTTTHLDDRGRVVRADTVRFVLGPPPPEAPLGLVFLDPPYDAAPELVGTVLGSLADGPWISPNVVAVIEAPSASPLALPAGWRSEWERRYGATLVVFAERDEA